MVAALVDDERDGEWATQQLTTASLAAPHLLPVEVASTLRRTSLAGLITLDVATLAHADLLELRVSLFPYEPLALRIWQLRPTITAYDAWYVALAESLDCPLATLDRRLVRAPGPSCAFIAPP